MTTVFPAALDSFYDPLPTDLLSGGQVAHASQHDNINDAMAQVQKLLVGPFVVNAKAYGAKGDGVTDDTTAIQSALTATGATGGMVVFPPGVYMVSGPLNIGNQTFLWAPGGPRATTIQALASFPTTSQSGLVVFAAAQATLFRNCGIVGFGFDTSLAPAVGHTNVVNGIFQNNDGSALQDCLFENLLFQLNSTGQAILLKGLGNGTSPSHGLTFRTIHGAEGMGAIFLQSSATSATSGQVSGILVDDVAWEVSTNVVSPITAPTAPIVGTSPSGGTVAAGTYQVEVTLVNHTGESTASATSSVTTSGTTSTIQVTSPVAFGQASGYYVYATQAGGSTLTRQQAAGKPTPIGTTFTLTAPPTNTGANPPATNTCNLYGARVVISASCPNPGVTQLTGLVRDVDVRSVRVHLSSNVSDGTVEGVRLDCGNFGAIRNVSIRDVHLYNEGSPVTCAPITMGLGYQGALQDWLVDGVFGYRCTAASFRGYRNWASPSFVLRNVRQEACVDLNQAVTIFVGSAAVGDETCSVENVSGDSVAAPYTFSLILFSGGQTTNVNGCSGATRVVGCNVGNGFHQSVTNRMTETGLLNFASSGWTNLLVEHSRGITPTNWLLSGQATFRHNPGLNPVGSVAVPAAQPVSGTTYPNTSGYDVTVYVTGGTLTGGVQIGGVGTLLGTPAAFRLASGQTITINSTVAPNWVWFAD